MEHAAGWQSRIFLLSIARSCCLAKRSLTRKAMMAKACSNTAV